MIKNRYNAAHPIPHYEMPYHIMKYLTISQDGCSSKLFLWGYEASPLWDTWNQKRCPSWRAYCSLGKGYGLRTGVLASKLFHLFALNAIRLAVLRVGYRAISY